MKNRIIIIAISMFVVMILVGCDAEIPAPVALETTSPAVITPSQAMYIMAYRDVIILDVRTPDEFNTGHIPNAILLPVDEIAYAVTGMIPDKEQTILIYCRSGRRSADAANILVNMGYLNVYDFGGIINWTGEIQTISQ